MVLSNLISANGKGAVQMLELCAEWDRRVDFAKGDQLRLVGWMRGDQTWVEVSSIGAKLSDQELIKQGAARLFPESAMGAQGTVLLVEKTVLPELLAVVGFSRLSMLVRTMPAKSIQPSLPAEEVSAPSSWSAEQIVTFYQCLRRGELQADAARKAGMRHSSAARLRRGMIPADRLSADARAAYEQTFERTPALQEKSHRKPSDAIDARNATVIRNVYRLMQDEGLTLADAARKLDAGYDLALRLSKGPRPSMPPKTLKAWRQTFGRVRPAKAASAP